MTRFYKDTFGVSIRIFVLGFLTLGSSQFLYAQDDNQNHGGQDLLDDQSEVGYQEAVNGVLNTYNPQIAQLQVQRTALEADKAQCVIDMRQQQAEAQSQADQAKAQALQGMLGPGLQTLGSMMEGMGGGAEDESGRLQEEIDLEIEECNNNPNLRCREGSITVDVASCNNDATCLQNAKAARIEHQRNILELENEQSEVDEAGHGVMEGLMGAAAAGIGGNLASKAAQKGAAAQIANAAEAEKICQQRVDAQIAGIEANITQLQQQKARDLTMARISAEFATQQRRKAADLASDENDVEEDNPVAIADPLDIPEDGDGPIATASGDVTGSGGGGGGLPGGGPPGGGAGAGGGNGWVFGGGGGGFDGGNTLPPQSTAGAFEATGGGGNGIITPGKGNGFGSGFAKFSEEEAQGGEEVVGVGDGGLRVLMARTSLIMAKHSPTLMKSLNFEKLAKRAEERGREAASVNSKLNNGLK